MSAKRTKAVEKEKMLLTMPVSGMKSFQGKQASGKKDSKPSLITKKSRKK